MYSLFLITAPFFAALSPAVSSSPLLYIRCIFAYFHHVHLPALDSPVFLSYNLFNVFCSILYPEGWKKF